MTQVESVYRRLRRQLFVGMLAFAYLTCNHVYAGTLASDSDKVHATEARNFSSSLLELHATSRRLDGTTSEIVEVCNGECTFVIAFGDKSIVMSKDTQGVINDAQIVPSSTELGEAFHTIDLRSSTIDFAEYPFIRVGDRAYLVTRMPSGEFVILEGEVNSTDPNFRLSTPSSKHLGSGTFEVEDGTCPTVTVYENVSCRRIGDIYRISWDECEVRNCSNIDRPYKSCTHFVREVQAEVFEIIGIVVPGASCKSGA